MSGAVPLQRIPVAVLVERKPAASPWIDHVWTPVAVLPGLPDAADWTVVAENGDTTTYFAGSASIELYRTETGNYRDNLVREQPQLWVVLRPTGLDPPFTLISVTADPAEGEAFTEPGTDLVEAVPMPDTVREELEEFVLTHHVERTFFKRSRDRLDPEALARKPAGPKGQSG